MSMQNINDFCVAFIYGTSNFEIMVNYGIREPLNIDVICRKLAFAQDVISYESNIFYKLYDDLHTKWNSLINVLSIQNM